MNNLKQIERLRKLHGMIKRETTGSPRQIARNMRISERQLYLLLEHLKEMEAPLRFSRRANTYFYDGEFDLLVNVSIQVMQGEEIVTIYAGKGIYLTSAIACKVHAVGGTILPASRQS